MIKFTYHKTYPFVVYNSVSFSIFAALCNHCHLIQNISSSPKETLYLSAITFHLPIPTLTTTKNFLSICIYLIRTFNIDRIIHYLSFCDWFFSHTIFSFLLNVHLGSFGNTIFDILRNCQIVFQYGCTISHSH